MMWFSIDAVIVCSCWKRSCLSHPIFLSDSSNSGSSCMQYQNGNK